MEKSVCFTGHRVIGYDFSIDRLRTYIKAMIEVAGVTKFIVGGALGFDTIVAKEILALKRDGAQIELHVYAPCNNQSAKWGILDKMTYNKILKQADYVNMVDRPYYDGCMRERNYKMVDNAKYCICYFNGKTSGTSQTVRYAKKKGLEIYNTSSLSPTI